MASTSADSVSRCDRVFLSLFPPPTSASLANRPSTTKHNVRHGQTSNHDTAWNLITSWLSASKSVDRGIRKGTSPAGLDDALSILLLDNSMGKSLLDWFMSEVQIHYENMVKSKLQALWFEPISCSMAMDRINQSLDLLQTAQQSVLLRLDIWLASRHRHGITQALQTLRSNAVVQMQNIALHSIPAKKFSKALAYMMHKSLCSWLLSSTPNDMIAERIATIELLTNLQVAGFGDELGQRVFAQVMNGVIDSFVQSATMKVDWMQRESIVDRLRQWVERSFIPAVTDGLRSLTGDTSFRVALNESSEWQSAALDRLAKQRIKFLLDYVKAWPHSTGAILDLKEYMHSSEGKILLANSFSQQLNRRLLHAGVTTSELLSIYINVIMAFKTLDPRGVLLDKVAVPLRSYLRLRDDTVRIIAASFLADVDDDGRVPNPSDELCSDLAREITLSEGEAPHTEHKGLDWDDMEWMPDPIDAGPDYKKFKSEDIISFMLTLFEQADFIKEIQSLLGERLLSVGYDDTELEKEIRLVELFKTRFGADRLQSCEVMLRDILDSRRINKTLRPKDDFPTMQEVYAAIPIDGISSQGLIAQFQHRVPRTNVAGQKFVALIKAVAVADKASDLLFPMPDYGEEKLIVSDGTSTAFYTQILSSFFWPSLREDEFAVPPPIATMQKSFEQDFERIKNLRKLHWLSALGRATVELELDDRTVKVEGVQTWQASVIYAFQSDSEEISAGQSPSKTVQELETSLSMDEVLVRNALAFWIGHRVLVESEPDLFTVLETLPSADQDISAAPAAPVQAEAAISAVKSQDAVLQDNRPMYELFIVGMLTNGGAMDAARVTMMMKMVVPGGYNYGEDETKWLLAGLEEQGKVVNSGNTYSIKK